MSERGVTLQVGVKVLLKNGEGRYLTLRRSLEAYPEVSGRWDIVGGRIDPGTPLLENLTREVREETGLTIVGTPRLIAAQDITPTPDRHIIRLTYAGEANDGPLILDTEENDDYRWLTKEELKNLEDIDVYLKELIEQQGDELF